MRGSTVFPSLLMTVTLLLINGTTNAQSCEEACCVSGGVTVDKLVRLVGLALSGCSDATPTPEPTVTNRWNIGPETIGDRQTGLVWQKFTTIAETEQGYRWPNGVSDQIGTLNLLQFAGRADWRLPSVADFQTIQEGDSLMLPFRSPCERGCTGATCSCSPHGQTPSWTSDTGMTAGMTVPIVFLGNGTFRVLREDELSIGGPGMSVAFSIRAVSGQR